MPQRSFSSVEYEQKKVKTRRQQFLERMDRLVPWDELAGRIAPVYPKPGRSMVNSVVKPDGVYSVSPASEAVLALVAAEENELDPAKRKDLITELFLQHAREATFLFLIEPKEGVLLRSGVVWPAGAKQRRAIMGCYPVHKLV